MLCNKKIKPGDFIKLFLFVSFLFCGNYIFSQSDCSSKIQEAQKYYEQGMIDEIPAMLGPCMSDGFNRTQKIEAYKLIIMSYLLDDDQFEAEKTMLEFLKKFPEYEIMPNDPVEFVYLFESYRTASVFSIGLFGGLNVTDPRIIEPFSTFDIENATLKNTMKPGFQLGLGIERYISRKFLLNLEILFALNKYQFTDETKNNLNRSSVAFTEKLYKIEAPLTLSYEFTVKKTHLIVRAGFSGAKIMNVSGRPECNFYPDNETIKGPDQDITDYRKQFLYSGIIGAGLRYKVPRGVLLIDLRGKIGLNNIVVEKKRYDNPTLYNKFYYVDDDFSINSLSLSVGYYFSFYSPRKQR